MSMLAAWSGRASAQTASAMLQLPPGPAPVVRLRWPDTTLGPRDAARLVTLTDGDGQPVPFALVIAPEDAGHATHPLWLVLRADRHEPLTVAVAVAVDGGGSESTRVLEWNDMVGDRTMTLERLPLRACHLRIGAASRQSSPKCR
jgi:hypothetical protein